MNYRKYLWLPVAAMLFMTTALQAQMQNEEPVAPVRFGILAGANFNSVGVGGGSSVPVPTSEDLSDGSGLGPYGGLMFEYNPAPKSPLGVQGRITYDSRTADFGDAPNSVEANIAYLSVEPGMRINLGSPKFHFVAGPSISVLARNSFDIDTNGTLTEDVEYGLLNDVTFGLWGGVGFDIPISEMSNGGNQWYLTPFFEGSWMVDQVKSSAASTDNLDDTWSTVTVRGGVQLKYGVGGPESEDPAAVEVVDITPPSTFKAMIVTPAGGVVERRPMIEYLPLLNYVFFEEGETPIPNKYVELSSTQAKAFDESSLMVIDEPGAGGSSDQSTRSDRQLGVYYNVMNIMADRLEKSPSSKITVVGSGNDLAAARARAENVKNYLVSKFGIAESRLEVKAQKTPVNPSGTRSTPKEDLPLVEKENIRVELLSDDTELLKPVKLRVFQDEPVESDMMVSVEASVPLTRWNVNITGNGYSGSYGPFYGSSARINAAPILGTDNSGRYTATVKGTDRSGNTLTTVENFTLNKKVLEPLTSTRYSILFEYDDSESLAQYEEFLRETVAPNIPDGSVVYIHGHTDIAGLEEYNQTLSEKRAKEAQRILASEVKKMGHNVQFETYGFGETQYRAPFDNSNPEQRYYNRTVMIEIIPEAVSSR